MCFFNEELHIIYYNDPKFCNKLFLVNSAHPVQTEIRLLLEKQSAQGLNCLLFHLHRLVAVFYYKTSLAVF